MKKLTIIIGARPQFIKHAALEITLKNEFLLNVIHTGQHYDKNMSAIFFEELGINEPDIILNIGSKTHAQQTGLMMIEIEAILLTEKPDAMIVYGDTNSTLAGALAAQKLGIPIFHIEAGLRSRNKKMPEEVNRILTDHISELLFAPTKNAINNLKEEGIINGVHVVGDVMYDLLKLSLKNNIIKKLNFEPYYYATIHRPYNTDDGVRLSKIFKSLNELDAKVKIALHPRTLNKLKEFQIDSKNYNNIKIYEPQAYFDNLNLLFNSKGLITDSGGMQKEAYWLKKKCITLRSETEWTETLENNWNELVFEDLSTISKLMKNPAGSYDPYIYGNGDTSMRICKIIKNHLY